MVFGFQKNNIDRNISVIVELGRSTLNRVRNMTSKNTAGKPIRAVNFKHWENDTTSTLLVCIGSDASTAKAKEFLEEEYRLAWVKRSYGKIKLDNDTFANAFTLYQHARNRHFDVNPSWNKDDQIVVPLNYAEHIDDSDNYRPPVVITNADLRKGNRTYLNMEQSSVRFLLIGKLPDDCKKAILHQLQTHRIFDASIDTISYAHDDIYHEDRFLKSQVESSDELTATLKTYTPEYFAEAGIEVDEDDLLPPRADIRNIEFDNDTPDSFIRDYLVDRTNLLSGFSIDEAKLFLFSWDGRKWDFCEESDFKLHIDKTCLKPVMPEGYSNRRVASISDMCKRDLSIMHTSKRNLINFQNCVMEISKDGQLTTFPHNKSFGLTTIADYAYIEGATETPYFDKWINHASCDSEGKFSQERYDVLMATCYWVITNQYQWQFFVEIVGDGGTGKSIFVKIIEALAGGFESICYMSLGGLEGGEGKGPLKGLIGKRVLMMPEQPQYYGSLEALKRITGNDPFSIPIMAKADYVMPFFPGVALSMSNQPLASTDKSSAIERRRVTVYMDNKVKEEDKIIGMSDLIKEEIPALFNKVTSYFSKPEDARIILSNYRSSEDKQKALIKADVLVNWITDNLEPCDGGRVRIGSVIAYNEARKGFARQGIEKVMDESRKALYVNYRAWCNANDVSKPISPRNFSDLLVQRLSQLKQLGFHDCTIIKPQRQSTVTNIAINQQSNMFEDLKEELRKYQ